MKAYASESDVWFSYRAPTHSLRLCWSLVSLHVPTCQHVIAPDLLERRLRYGLQLFFFLHLERCRRRDVYSDAYCHSETLRKSVQPIASGRSLRCWTWWKWTWPTSPFSRSGPTSSSSPWSTNARSSTSSWRRSKVSTRVRACCVAPVSPSASREWYHNLICPTLAMDGVFVMCTVTFLAF